MRTPHDIGLIYDHAAGYCAGERLGLTGWVKNCSDGSVEIHAEGDKAKLEELIAWCRKGPALASVSNIDESWVESEGLHSFDIR